MKIKVIQNKEIRVWKYPKHSKYQSLLGFVAKTFGLFDANSFTLQYQDDEGDTINIRNDRDINDALQFAEEEGRKSLKIYLISQQAMDSFLDDALGDLFGPSPVVQTVKPKKVRKRSPAPTKRSPAPVASRRTKPTNPSIKPNHRPPTLSAHDLIRNTRSPPRVSKPNKVMDPTDILASMMMEEEEEKQSHPSSPQLVQSVHSKQNGYANGHSHHTPRYPNILKHPTPPRPQRQPQRQPQPPSVNEMSCDDIMNSMILDMDTNNTIPPPSGIPSAHKQLNGTGGRHQSIRSTNPEDVIQRIVDHKESPHRPSSTGDMSYQARSDPTLDSTDDILKGLLSDSDDQDTSMPADIDPMDIINRIVNKPSPSHKVPVRIVEPTVHVDPAVIPNGNGNEIGNDIINIPSADTKIPLQPSPPAPQYPSLYAVNAPETSPLPEQPEFSHSPPLQPQPQSNGHHLEHLNHVPEEQRPSAPPMTPNTFPDDTEAVTPHVMHRHPGVHPAVPYGAVPYGMDSNPIDSSLSPPKQQQQDIRKSPVIPTNVPPAPFLQPHHSTDSLVQSDPDPEPFVHSKPTEERNDGDDGDNNEEQSESKENENDQNIHGDDGDDDGDDEDDRADIDGADDEHCDIIDVLPDAPEHIVPHRVVADDEMEDADKQKELNDAVPTAEEMEAIQRMLAHPTSFHDANIAEVTADLTRRVSLQNGTGPSNVDNPVNPMHENVDHEFQDHQSFNKDDSNEVVQQADELNQEQQDIIDDDDALFAELDGIDMEAEIRRLSVDHTNDRIEEQHDPQEADNGEEHEEDTNMVIDEMDAIDENMEISPMPVNVENMDDDELQQHDIDPNAVNDDVNTEAVAQPVEEKPIQGISDEIVIGIDPANFHGVDSQETHPVTVNALIPPEQDEEEDTDDDASMDLTQVTPDPIEPAPIAFAPPEQFVAPSNPDPSTMEEKPINNEMSTEKTKEENGSVDDAVQPESGADPDAKDSNESKLSADATAENANAVNNDNDSPIPNGKINCAIPSNSPGVGKSGASSCSSNANSPASTHSRQLSSSLLVPGAIPPDAIDVSPRDARRGINRLLREEMRLQEKETKMQQKQERMAQKKKLQEVRRQQKEEEKVKRMQMKEARNRALKFEKLRRSRQKELNQFRAISQSETFEANKNWYPIKFVLDTSVLSMEWETHDDLVQIIELQSTKEYRMAPSKVECVFDSDNIHSTVTGDPLPSDTHCIVYIYYNWRAIQNVQFQRTNLGLSDSDQYIAKVNVFRIPPWINTMSSQVQHNHQHPPQSHEPEISIINPNEIYARLLDAELAKCRMSKRGKSLSSSPLSLFKRKSKINKNNKSSKNKRPSDVESRISSTATLLPENCEQTPHFRWKFDLTQDYTQFDPLLNDEVLKNAMHPYEVYFVQIRNDAMVEDIPRLYDIFVIYLNCFNERDHHREIGHLLCNLSDGTQPQRETNSTESLLLSYLDNVDSAMQIVAEIMDFLKFERCYGFVTVAKNTFPDVEHPKKEEVTFHFGSIGDWAKCAIVGEKDFDSDLRNLQKLAKWDNKQHLSLMAFLNSIVTTYTM